MPVSTLIATAGASNANSYTDVAFADQYHADRPPVSTTWTAATTDQKTAALLWATKILEQYVEWRGTVVDTTQALLWPRAGLVALNGWEALDHTTIPVQIQWATAEFARQLLVSDRMGDSEVESQGLKLLKVGPIRLDFKEWVYAKPVPDIVARLIPESWGYIRSRGERDLVRT
jgi:hypothetical protein